MIEPTILFEDDNILAVNKPAGLVVHSDGRTKERTLVDWLMEKYPNMKEVGEPVSLSSGELIYRPGIVHRLDRDTSGVLLVAKNNTSFHHLKQQFQERDMEKVYHALVYGPLHKDEDVIDRPIGRSNKDFRLWSAQRGARGELREAITAYKVLIKSPDTALVEVRPKTGRTHQIRVHFKAINSPVVCDPLYAPKRECVLGLTRTGLHAKSITFATMEGDMKTVEAPYPEDFGNAVVMLQKQLEG